MFSIKTTPMIRMIKITKTEKELMQEAYFTMRTLRQIFERHPKSKLVEIEKRIDKVVIKNF